MRYAIASTLAFGLLLGCATQKDAPVPAEEHAAETAPDPQDEHHTEPAAQDAPDPAPSDEGTSAVADTESKAVTHPDDPSEPHLRNVSTLR